MRRRAWQGGRGGREETAVRRDRQGPARAGVQGGSAGGWARVASRAAARAARLRRAAREWPSGGMSPRVQGGQPRGTTTRRSSATSRTHATAAPHRPQASIRPGSQAEFRQVRELARSEFVKAIDVRGQAIKRRPAGASGRARNCTERLPVAGRRARARAAATRSRNTAQLSFSARRPPTPDAPATKKNPAYPNNGRDALASALRRRECARATVVDLTTSASRRWAECGPRACEPTPPFSQGVKAWAATTATSSSSEGVPQGTAESYKKGGATTATRSRQPGAAEPSGCEREPGPTAAAACPWTSSASSADAGMRGPRSRALPATGRRAPGARSMLGLPARAGQRRDGQTGRTRIARLVARTGPAVGKTQPTRPERPAGAPRPPGARRGTAHAVMRARYVRSCAARESHRRRARRGETAPR